MKQILPLSQHVIAKIAAGEVIERPVYAVKELVENALDAGADHIVVQLEESGLKKITVSDNGSGMTRADLLEAYKPHTTSKLQTVEDLQSIHTMGFRGEALASITAISHLTIASRAKGTTSGISITLRNGIIEKEGLFGMPEGTIVTVRNLFHSVPSRKKFLKSDRTEFRHIIDFLTKIAIAYPQVHLTFSHNNKAVVDLPKTDTVLSRIQSLLGEQFFESLLPIVPSEETIQLEGFFTKPHFASKSLQRQYAFLNSRSITDKVINAAIKDAYGTLIEPTAYPAFIINIMIPPEYVDVNVHPRKESVRFVDQQAVYETVFQTVKKTLAEHKLIPMAAIPMLSDAAKVYNDGKGWRSGRVGSYAGQLLKENREPWSFASEETISTEALQMHNVYLITQTKSGVLFIDQHAAHERILYEQILAEFTKKKQQKEQFHLAKPVLIEMSYADSELVQEYLPLLQHAGFTVEHFRENTFYVRAVPLLLQDREVGQLVSELLVDLSEEKNPKDLDTVSQRMIAYLACRGAVKAGDKLSKKQIKELIEKLKKTPNNATCPHGRPTRVEMAWGKLGRMFGRKS
ncbi:MAG: DNA mismatch repair endonuclease MutL [Patescibacteria group bacterium]